LNGIECCDESGPAITTHQAREFNVTAHSINFNLRITTQPSGCNPVKSIHDLTVDKTQHDWGETVLHGSHTPAPSAGC
jgi:hypothetical protein